VTRIRICQMLSWDTRVMMGLMTLQHLTRKRQQSQHLLRKGVRGVQEVACLRASWWARCCRRVQPLALVRLQSWRPCLGCQPHQDSLQLPSCHCPPQELHRDLLQVVNLLLPVSALLHLLQPAMTCPSNWSSNLLWLLPSQHPRARVIRVRGAAAAAAAARGERVTAGVTGHGQGHAQDLGTGGGGHSLAQGHAPPPAHLAVAGAAAGAATGPGGRHRL
jgi:hypothetical protein